MFSALIPRTNALVPKPQRQKPKSSKPLPRRRNGNGATSAEDMLSWPKDATTCSKLIFSLSVFSYIRTSKANACLEDVNAERTSVTPAARHGRPAAVPRSMFPATTTHNPLQRYWNSIVRQHGAMARKRPYGIGQFLYCSGQFLCCSDTTAHLHGGEGYSSWHQMSRGGLVSS